MSEATAGDMGVGVSGKDIRRMCLDWAVPHRVLDRSEADKAAKLTEVLKRFLRNRAVHMVKSSGDRPLLYCYQGGSTPVLAQATHVAKPMPHVQVRRRAAEAAEYHSERAFIKWTNSFGQPTLAVVLRDLRPLLAGKKGWNLFASAIEHFPDLRFLGFRGLLLRHYAFDRAVFSSVFRRVKQYRYHWYDGGDSMGCRGKLEWMLDFCVSTGCCNHDVHNAMRWGLEFLVSTPTFTKDVHIIVASLRNAYDLVVGFLAPFVSQHLEFKNSGYDRAETYAMWVALGIDSEMSDQLAMLDIRFEDGRLFVGEAMQDEPRLIEQVSGCLLFVFKWKQFCDSRWMTIGSVARSVIASVALGIEALVGMILKSDSSQYHIGGFARMSDEIRRYMMCASLAAHGCDNLLVEMLDDDRLLRRLQVLEDGFRQEVEWAASLPPSVFHRLGKIAGKSGVTARQDTLKAMTIAGAYIDRKVFKVANRLPVFLAIGDISANLAELRQRNETTGNDMSDTLKALMGIGYSTSILESTILLLREIHWSTAPAEQGRACRA